MIEITMTATYDTCEWHDDDEYPEEGGGFTDPYNPWGGFRQEIPHDAGPEWFAANVTRATFSNLLEAAEFVIDFPGGVWDYREGEWEPNYRTGEDTQVTLHVEDGPWRTAVLNVAAAIEAARDAHLARVRAEQGRRLRESMANR